MYVRVFMMLDVGVLFCELVNHFQADSLKGPERMPWPAAQLRMMNVSLSQDLSNTNTFLLADHEEIKGLRAAHAAKNFHV